jgi:anti-anti-sigma factor
MDFSSHIANKVVVFELSGKIMTCNDATPLMDKLKQFISSGKKNFIMDFSGVPWMNSQGVAMVIWALTTTRNADGSIVFSGLSESVERILEVTRLNKILDRYPNIDQALSAFSSNS